MRAAVYAGTWDAVSNVLQGMGMVRVRKHPELFEGDNSAQNRGLSGQGLERALDVWSLRHPEQVH